MLAKKDVILLVIDETTVTIGAQFREVALGLLITRLNPATSSYAWYFLIGSLPGLFFARTYGWASRRFGARQVMIASYGLRLILVLGLWRVTNFWVALLFLAGLATSRGFYSASQAHYVAVQGDFAGTRNIVMRLRQSESIMRLAGPLLAGSVLTWIGYRNGFLVSATTYGLAMVALTNLSPLSLKNREKKPDAIIPWRPDSPALAMMALSFLTWQANTLAMAYTFHILHRHTLGYGIALSVWGGSGLAAGFALSRIHGRPLRFIAPLFGVLGLSWLILARGVSFIPFVLLGGVEGFAGWMVQDLVVSLVLSKAFQGHAGHARAKLDFYGEIGSIAGTTTLLLVPASWLILPMYTILGILGIAIAGAWMMASRGRQFIPPFEAG